MESSIRKGSIVAMVTPSVSSCSPVSSPLVANCPHGPHTPVVRPFYIIESPVHMIFGNEQGKLGSAPWWMGWYRSSIGPRDSIGMCAAPD